MAASPEDAAVPDGPSGDPEPGVHARPAAPVEADLEGSAIWTSLCETWLTQRVVATRDTSVKGGYHWDTDSYLPVFLTDEDGDPVLAFARR